MALKLKGLNKPQLEVVRFGDGPLMVIAGAGSGKTRCLTYRVARLVDDGVLPSRIMVTTFTTKAAEEMDHRLSDLIGDDKVGRLRIGTYHSLFRKVLMDLVKENRKREAPTLIQGGGQFFVILNHLNATKQKGDIKEILKQISWWKNKGKRIEDLEKEMKPTDFRFEYLEFYKVYEQHLKENNKIDFDDMLFKTYWMLQDPKNEAYLSRLRKRLDYILVDEAQDLNDIQFMLLRTVCVGKKNVTIVLDDFQLLYGFRGSSIDNIFGFIKEYNPTLIKLEQNYRSSETIVTIGNNLIKHNKKQIEKTLFTDKGPGQKATVYVATDADDEAEKVLEAIHSFAADGYKLNDMAILYRTNSQSRAFVDILIRHDVPHIVHSNFGFYDRKEVKDIVSYLRIVASPHEADIDDFRRVINKPSRFIGNAFIDAVEAVQIEHDLETFWEALQRYNEVDMKWNQIQNAGRFVEVIIDLNKKAKEAYTSTGTVIGWILKDTGYGEWLKRQMEDSMDTEPDDDKELNLDALMAGANRFPRVEHFLRYVDSIDENAYEDEDDVIHLMTVHKSKGTEYPIVFVAGCSEGLLPHRKADDLEEERRVGYVAVTRAMEKLVVSLIHGKYSRFNVTASRFVTEMGLEIPQTLGHTRVGYVSPVGNGFPDMGPPLGVVKDKLGGEAHYNIHGAKDAVEVPNFGVIEESFLDEEEQ